MPPNNSSTPSPFPFMSLPKEIRLMIYERLPRRVVHTRIPVPPHPLDPSPLLILLMRTFSVQLLRVSRTIHSEAYLIVQKAAKEWILSHPVHVIGSCYVGLEVIRNLFMGMYYERAGLLEGDHGVVSHVIEKYFRLYNHNPHKPSPPVFSLTPHSHPRITQFIHQTALRGMWSDMEMLVLRPDDSPSPSYAEMIRELFEYRRLRYLQDCPFSFPAVLARSAAEEEITADTAGLLERGFSFRRPEASETEFKIEADIMVEGGVGIEWDVWVKEWVEGWKAC